MRISSTILACLFFLTTYGQISDPMKLKGDTLIIKVTENAKVMKGFEGFIKEYKKITKYDFYLNGRADDNIFYNDGSGRTPIDKLAGQKFFCKNVIPFGEGGANFFLELQDKELGIIYYKLSSSLTSKYPFYQKDEYNLFLKQQVYEAEKAKNAPPKDYCAILFYESGKRKASKLSLDAQKFIGTKWDNIDFYHSSEILPLSLHVQKGNSDGNANTRFYSIAVNVLSKYDYKGEDVMIKLIDGSEISGKATSVEVKKLYSDVNYSFRHTGTIQVTKEKIELMAKSKVEKVIFHLHENKIDDLQAAEILEYAKCIIKK